MMICKAYIKASEDSIHGSKQKIALFKTQLLMAYNGIKADQEEENVQDMAKPLHLKPSGCNLIAPVLYPECTRSSLHQHFTKKISPTVIKYMSVAKQVSIYSVLNKPGITVTHSFCLLVQNPRKSGEDDGAYHAHLGHSFKEK